MSNRPHQTVFSRPPGRLVNLFGSGFLCIAIAGIGTDAVAEELAYVFNGDTSELTEEFEVDGPWLLDWHVTSDFPKYAGIEINLVDSVFLNHKGSVLIARSAGAGTKLFYDTGRLRFRIDANATRWILRISRITEEEAARMIRIDK